jgi:hypothetical protein
MGKGDQIPESPDTDTNAVLAELEAMRAENEALRAQLAASQQPADRSGRVRSVASWILVALSLLVVLAAVHAAWLQTTISDEERFVDTFAPLPRETAVATALSQRLTTELFIATDVAGVVEQSLPPDLAFLTVPVTEGLRNLTAEVTGEVIASDVFAGIWRQALRLSHNAASLVVSTDGRVAIDLNEAADEVVAGLEAEGVTLLSGLDIELPEIVVFENDQLQSAAGAMRFINTMGWLLPLLAVLLIAAAIWVAPARRRATAVIGFGSAVVILVTLVAVRLARGGTVSSIDDETQRAAAEAIWDTTLRFYRQSMWSLAILGLVVGFAAWVMGTSPRALRTRAWWSGTIDRWRGRDATVPTSGVAGFVAEWQRAIQWAVLILGLLFVLIVPAPSGWLVVVTGLVVVAITAVVQIVAGPGGSDEFLDVADEAKEELPVEQ